MLKLNYYTIVYNENMQFNLSKMTLMDLDFTHNQYF